MALGTNHLTLSSASSGTSARTRSNSAFIPELWVDETLAAFKTNLVLAGLVIPWDFTGRKGDTVHIPVMRDYGAPSTKVEGQQVTLVKKDANKLQFVIDQHKEYSFMEEDILAIQASNKLRQFYTAAAGYVLAKEVDDQLHTTLSRLAGADANPVVAGTTNFAKSVVPTANGIAAWNPAASSNAGNAADLNDTAIRRLIKELDDSDVPSMMRHFVVNPKQKMELLGIDRFTRYDAVGESGSGNSIRNGKIGNAYGVDFYVTSNCKQGNNSAAVKPKQALFFQEQSGVVITQRNIHVEAQRKTEYLGDLYVSDMIFKTGLLRPESGISVMVSD